MKKTVLINNEEVTGAFKRKGKEFFLKFGGKDFSGQFISEENGVLSFLLEGKKHRIVLGAKNMALEGRVLEVVSPRDQQKSRSGGGHDNGMESPMPGKILKVLVKKDQKVEQGAGLVVMEAMKMEHTIKASYAGVVKAIQFKEGDLVDGGVELVELEAEKED